MTFTIDTENKTISFNSSINVGELVTQLKKMLPDWKEYELINISYSYLPFNPIIEPYIYPSYPTTYGVTSKLTTT